MSMMPSPICKKLSMIFTKSSTPKLIKSIISNKKNLIPSFLTIHSKEKKSAMSPKILSKESGSAKLCSLKIKPNKTKPKEPHLSKKWKSLQASKINQCPQEVKQSQTKYLSSYPSNMVNLPIILQNYWKKAILESPFTHRFKWQNSKR